LQHYFCLIVAILSQLECIHYFPRKCRSSGFTARFQLPLAKAVIIKDTPSFVIADNM